MITTTTIDYADLDNKANTTCSVNRAKCGNDIDSLSTDNKEYGTATILPVHVSLCLGSHELCTGFYSDEHGQFLLKCGCSCHQSDIRDDTGMNANCRMDG
jgi:hypothetical protein